MVHNGRQTCWYRVVAILKGALTLPQFISADPKLIRDAFDHEDFIFELKMDGFRGVAYIGKNGTHLVSKGGRVMKRFANLGAAIHSELNCEAVFDGEIVVLDSEGCPRFYDLLRRRVQPVFYVFDVLWLDGKDLRFRPLLERKSILRSIVPKQPSVLLYADHIEPYGIDFFRLACQRDLEGIVAKRKAGAYGESWFKIRNPVYSQYEGRPLLRGRTTLFLRYQENIRASSCSARRDERLRARRSRNIRWM